MPPRRPSRDSEIAAVKAEHEGHSTYAERCVLGFRTANEPHCEPYRLAEALAASEHARRWLDEALNDSERELAASEARVERIGALFAGGPDTPCRTTWRAIDVGIGPYERVMVECVEVPLDDLRDAFR